MKRGSWTMGSAAFITRLALYFWNRAFVSCR